ncbi:MAG: response regulator [Myxococcales bacterium]|nr:response regulator [Myxococcales bacterium]
MTKPPQTFVDLRARELADRVAALFGEAPGAGVDAVEHALSLLKAAEDERRLPVYARGVVDEVTDALFSIAAHDFQVSLKGDGTGDPLDALTVAVGVLAAELGRTAVSTARIASLLQSLPNPVLVVDLDRRVEEANPAARALLGEDLVGRPVHAVLDADESLWPRSATPVRLTVALDDAHLLFSVAPLISHFDDVEGFVAVGTNITEQVRMQQALGEARDLAEGNARARSQFLANMSHEIRTPLNGVLGMSQLLLDGGLHPGQAELVRGIRSSGEHLLSLINDVLDFSKVDAGHLELEIRRFDPRALIERSMEMIGSRRQEGVALMSDLGPLPDELLGDALRVRQVVLNLLSNALKFTRRGKVVVRCHEVHRDWRSVVLRYEVEDTGVGISAEHLTRLFDPFTQADSSTTRQFGGTGLGLAIVQRMVGALGGEVGVNSRVGRGSRFWFTVPFERPRNRSVPPFDPGAVVDPALVGVQRERRTTDVPFDPVSNPRTPPRTDRLVLAGRRVLLVEDNPINQKVAIHMVERLGASVVVAANGAEAIKCVAAEVFDLILMDCQMPVMDGLEATRRIRRLDQGREVPVVALTADAVAGQRDRCIDAGMDDYLSKPLRMSDLERTLGTLLTSREAE